MLYTMLTMYSKINNDMQGELETIESGLFNGSTVDTCTLCQGSIATCTYTKYVWYGMKYG